VGPTDLGLEVVAILAMALPIAIVGLMQAQRWRSRIIYVVAAGVLVLAMLSTFRKSALLAPLAIGATLAYFRPRMALKLAPFAALAVAALAIFSFDAFDAVTGQFASDRLDVGTVSDRVSDYDAVRPDLLSEPAFGSGLGSYEHTFAPADYRILDSDLLGRLVDTGLVGLAAFLFMIGTVIAVAAPMIRSLDPRRAPAALAVAGAAAAFLVLTMLFDEWGFPHAVYAFLTLSGLLAVIAEPAGSAEPARTLPPPRGLESDPIDGPRTARRDDRARIPTPV
jgi:O-antigen ligase